jgi:hypothetical protein
MQVEVHVNQDLHGNRMPLVHGRMESVLPDCFDGFLVQSHAEVTDEANVLGIPFRIHDELD